MTPTKQLGLVGPIAEPGLPAVGGYESANLRLLDTLRQIVPDTQPFAYAQTSGSQFRKAWLYAAVFARLGRAIALRHGRNSAIHFTPLCRHFLWAEILLALAARARGNALTIDLRAGMQKRWYDTSSMLYRWTFRRLLSLATTIAYEGEAYEGWLRLIAPTTKRAWLPNFVPAAMLRRRDGEQLPAAPRFIYVGAISEAKGVEAALRVFRLLRQRLTGTSLTLVGRIDAGYRRELSRLDLLGTGVEIAGELEFGAIETRLDESHFFIFLSHWFGEGHSNALTEAMARGCVPIATDHGFNRSVIGPSAILVADRDNSTLIADVIEDSWRSGRWGELSDAVVSRVADNFTDRQALEVLMEIYGEPVHAPRRPLLRDGTPERTAPG